jgi:hypothetical protein
MSDEVGIVFDFETCCRGNIAKPGVGDVARDSDEYAPGTVVAVFAIKSGLPFVVVAVASIAAVASAKIVEVIEAAAVTTFVVSDEVKAGMRQVLLL